MAAGRPEELGDLSAALASRGAVDVDARPQSPVRVVVRAHFEDEDGARAAVRELRAGGTLAVVGPATAGHETAWRRLTAPTWFADRACVCAPWSEFDRSDAEAVVEIDPGGGFGSGGHPTTALVLERIAALLRPGDKILDVGCGSGVLAVSGARLGAEAVVAIDVDETAVDATRHNAALNGVGDRVDARAESLAAIGGRFDLVVANIHAPILVAMAPDLGRVTAPGGHVVLSGLSRGQVSAVTTAMRPLAVVDRRERDEWVALTLASCEPKRSL